MATEIGGDKKPAAEDTGKERKSAGKRTSPALFVRQIIAELRKVIWPTRGELINYTVVSLVFVLVMMGLVFGLDWALQQGVFALFG